MIRHWLANATRETLECMAGQASLPVPLCGPSSPSVYATTGEGEGERGGVGAGGGIRLCRVCACVPAFFLCLEVFIVCFFLALCMGLVMGRFVPVAFTAFFLGRTSSPEEEVEEV